MLIPKLRYWRERRALTQEELAEKANVGTRSVAGYEAGAGARPGNVRKLAEALDIDVSALMEPEAPKAPSSSPVAPEQASEEQQADRLASRIRRLEHLDLGDLLEHRQELAEQLKNLKVPGTREEFFAGKDPYKDYAAYLDTTDELLATMMVLERTAGRVK